MEDRIEARWLFRLETFERQIRAEELKWPVKLGFHWSVSGKLEARFVGHVSSKVIYEELAVLAAATAQLSGPATGQLVREKNCARKKGKAAHCCRIRKYEL